MKSVILIGTDHKYQLPTPEGRTSKFEGFEDLIRNICSTHNIRAIAEEMSVEALEEDGLEESVASKICNELGYKHQYSDPTNKKRFELGIRQDADIRAEHIIDGSTEAEIEADVAVRGRAASDKIREQYWWTQISELDTWPLLFICGADHFESFASLIRCNDMEVFEAAGDWEPVDAEESKCT